MRKNVIIIKDTNGNTCFVAYPKMLDENQINKAINECNKYHQDEQERKDFIVSKLVELENKCNKLELDIKLDRGEITQEDYDKEINEYGK